MAQPVQEDSGGRCSVVALVGQRLVEAEFWDRLGLTEIKGQCLVEEKVALRRTTSG